MNKATLRRVLNAMKNQQVQLKPYIEFQSNDSHLAGQNVLLRGVQAIHQSEEWEPLEALVRHDSGPYWILASDIIINAEE